MRLALYGGAYVAGAAQLAQGGVSWWNNQPVNWVVTWARLGAGQASSPAIKVQMTKAPHRFV
jgi:hypothetical protein